MKIFAEEQLKAIAEERQRTEELREQEYRQMICAFDNIIKICQEIKQEEAIEESEVVSIEICHCQTTISMDQFQTQLRASQNCIICPCHTTISMDQFQTQLRASQNCNICPCQTTISMDQFQTQLRASQNCNICPCHTTISVDQF
jgi:hypothetical protein